MQTSTVAELYRYFRMGTGMYMLNSPPLTVICTLFPINSFVYSFGVALKNCVLLISLLVSDSLKAYPPDRDLKSLVLQQRRGARSLQNEELVPGKQVSGVKNVHQLFHSFAEQEGLRSKTWPDCPIKDNFYLRHYMGQGESNILTDLMASDPEGIESESCFGPIIWPPPEVT